MKIHQLLIALAVSLFSITTATQHQILAQPNQPDETEALTTTTAQQIAAKITIKIQVGQSGGSGVLIGKKGNTYLVLTNAHVIRAQSGISIKTPDGQSYTAQKVKNTQVGNFDLALLEFTSSRSYQQARFKNFGNGQAALTEGREVFAAGFPYDSNALRVVEGEISQLPQEAFVNGTQIGYITKGDIKQGMSGGPIFDSFGNLIGINSTLARPVINSYTYTDGTKAPKDKIAEYRKANWSVPIYNLLTRLNPDILYGYKNLPKLHRMTTPTGYMAQLDRQARQVTVRIENSKENGSGVIVARDGNSYYVLTAEHVVKNLEALKVTTHEQRTYKISASDIKRSEGTDLAIVKFTSTQPYQVATLGNYSISDGAVVFPGGWPAPTKIDSQQWQWQLNPGVIGSQERGEFQTQNKQSFAKNGGYDLIYSSMTYGGMSGGPIFDSAGRVIGIHGQAEGGGFVGSSLGISIKTFLGLANGWNLNGQKLQVTTAPPVTLNESKLASVRVVINNIPKPNNASDAQRWIEYGNQLYRLGKYTEAVEALNRAIALEPNSLNAHYAKGLALWVSGDNTTALKALDRAIALVPQFIAAAPKTKKSDFYYLWKYRSLSLRDLGDNRGALAAISEAIRLEPEDIILLNEKALLLSRLNDKKGAIAIYNLILAKGKKDWIYNNRGTYKYELDDKKGGIADYDMAIRINPQYPKAYYNRGLAKSGLGDRKGGIADYDMAIRINPQYTKAYYSRGISKSELGDKKGAMNDYDMAIRIDPKHADAYNNRGIYKSELGDKKGAIGDYDMAIRINPQSANAYTNRGLAKSELGDKKDAITDYDMAIRINPQFANAYSNRGLAKSELGDKKGAVADYDMAVRIDPKYADAYSNRGLAKSELGDKKGAITDYDMAIRINPQFANAYSNRGISKSELGDKKGAITDYDMAIRINPQFANAYYSRGISKSDLGDKKGAITDYDMAIRINPQFARAYSNRGIAKSELDDKKGAIADYDMAIRINPQSANTYTNRGLAKSDLGDKKGAVADHDMAIRINPQLADAYTNRGLAKSKLGDKKGAIADHDMAIRINPQLADAYTNRGLAKSELGDNKGAVADLTIAARLFKVQNNLDLYDRAMSLIQKISQ
jgi:tetratricopeptide (TPR) repeat protein/S1-C subfamily serine protease